MAEPNKITGETGHQRTLRRKAALWKERSSMDGHVQDISMFLLPRSSRFYSDDRNRTNAADYNSIIDETGTLAHGTLASGLMAGMTSPARPWFRLATPDTDLMEYAPVKTWLYKVNRKQLQIFAKSNAYRAFYSIYAQLGIAGVAANLVVDDYDNVLHNYPLVFGQYALACNEKGVVDTVYREVQLTVSQTVEMFGREACSQSVRNMWDRGNYDQTVKVVHAIEPRYERDPRYADSKNMPWSSCYYEEGRDREKQYLRESGFMEFPAVCPRWDVDGNDTYASRWPGATALGSVKQLQQEQLQKSTAIDYQVDPPLQIPTEYKNKDMDRLPGGTMYVDANSPTGGVRSAFDVNLRLDYLLADIQDVRGRINASFYVDLFRMLQNDTRSNITAREIAERHEEKLLMLGPVLERLHNEMLSPYIELTFAKMQRAGLFAKGQELEPPPELEGVELDVDFVSVLAQAQRAVGVASVDRIIGTVGSLVQLDPKAIDKIDIDQTIDVYADMLGADPSIIRADEEVEKIRAARAAQEQAAQLAAAAPAVKDYATAAQAASETDPNKLGQAMSQFSGYAVPGLN
jgi:hypothetical protein